MRKPARVLVLLSLGVLTVVLGLRAQTAPQAAVPSEKNQYRRYAEGVYARQVFVAPSPNGDYVVEIWRFSIPPNTKSEEIVLPGAAAVVVHLGSVAVSRSGGKREDLRLGGSLLLEDGERIAFVNTDRRAANLRVVIFSREGKP
jgi:hypothetical protein